MIRPYRPADLEDLLDVWYRASKVAHPFLSEDFLSGERRQIEETWLQVAETLVYVEDDGVIGFVSLVGNEVGAIFVDPQHQGKGVGTSLMNWARESREFLELDVFEENSIGRHFYERYGFEPIGTHLHEASDREQLRLRFGSSRGEQDTR